MRKFLLKTALFLVPVISMGMIMEYYLRLIPNEYSKKKRILDNHASELDILCLGSSHGYFDINPVFFTGKGFNAAFVSQTLYFDSQIVNKYKDRLDRLKIIIVPISYFSFYSRLEDSIESWRLMDYSIYCGIYSSNNVKYHFEIFNNTLSVNLDRLYAYYYEKKDEVTCSDLGFGLEYSTKRTKRDLNKTGLLAAARHQTKDDRFFSDNIKSLRSIIEVAHGINAKVILFTPPAWHTYRDNLNTQQLERTIRTATSTSREFNNVKYANFLSDPAFVEGDFYDADHLNELGAEKMTKKLNALIESSN